MEEKDQLLKWQAGESIHDKTKGRCCPDGSCCNPTLRADQDLIDSFVTKYLEDDVPNLLKILVFLEMMIVVKLSEQAGEPFMIILNDVTVH